MLGTWYPASGCDRSDTQHPDVIALIPSIGMCGHLDTEQYEQPQYMPSHPIHLALDGVSTWMPSNGLCDTRHRDVWAHGHRAIWATQYIPILTTAHPIRWGTWVCGAEWISTWICGTLNGYAWLRETLNEQALGYAKRSNG